MHRNFIRISGYEAPETEDGNLEEGILDTGEEMGSSEDTPLSMKEFLPEKIELRLKVEGIPLQDKGRQVSLTFDDRDCAPTPLYDKKSLAYLLPFDHGRALWQRIRLGYGDVGSSLFQGRPYPINGIQGQDFTLLMKKRVLFKHDFDLCPIAHERVSLFGRDQTLSWPSLQIDTTTLYPFGGYYAPGLSLEECQQVYFYLVEEDGETRVALWRESDCLEKKIIPPEGGVHKGQAYGFYPNQRKPSFAEALRGGELKIQIQHTFGTFVFRSVAFRDGFREKNGESWVHVEFRPV